MKKYKYIYLTFLHIALLPLYVNLFAIVGLIVYVFCTIVIIIIGQRKILELFADKLDASLNAISKSISGPLDVYIKTAFDHKILYIIFELLVICIAIIFYRLYKKEKLKLIPS